MTIIQSILVAIIQGLTEFLPVSSSAHIVIMTSIYKLFTNKEISMTSQEEIFFAIIIHLGTLISILTYFKKDILSIIKGLIEGIRTKNFNTPEALYGIYNSRHINNSINSVSIKGYSRESDVGSIYCGYIFSIYRNNFIIK